MQTGNVRASFKHGMTTESSGAGSCLEPDGALSVGRSEAMDDIRP
jgi:hypothetical protein